ncbi:MAG: polysaccharide biosynthesis C-terminal domain-containing protein [Oscillospiraceae bacterium]|nr:polysaccharide biosynthesis C-terminal domain-containing protein [Oscillospiraceae bacterium]
MRNNNVFNQKINKNIIKILLMFGITIVAQSLALMKSTLVASYFGTSEEIDAYNLVNSMISFVFAIVVSGIPTIIIPEYVNGNKKNAADTFITVIYGGGLMVAVMMLLLRYPLINLFSNRGDIFITTAANVLVILLLSQYLAAFSGITVAFFQCEGKYNIPKIINLICQIVVVVILLHKNGKISVIEYAVIIAFGSILGFIVDTFIAFKMGWRLMPRLCLNQESLSLLKKFIPMLFSGGIYQLSLFVDSIMASFLSTGMVTILSYSTQVSSMASSIVVGNLLQYIYPKIAKRINENGYQDRFWGQSRGLHAVVCLMIAGFMCVGREAIFVLLNHGKFSSEACEIVFFSAMIYIYGQGVSIIRDMMYRYFYAMGNTKIPAQNSVFVSISNILFSLLFVKIMGFYGIVLGTVLSSLISLGIIMYRFNKTIGFSQKTSKIIGMFINNFLIMLVTVVLVYLTKSILPIENDLLSILTYGVETVALYVLIHFVFNRQTISDIKSL